jgi:hypothetical protein
MLRFSCAIRLLCVLALLPHLEARAGRGSGEFQGDRIAGSGTRPGVLAGDANRDRSVNLADFAALAANFNAPGSLAQGDLNYSGVTETGDFSILASRLNTTLPAPDGAAPVRPSDRWWPPSHLPFSIAA